MTDIIQHSVFTPAYYALEMVSTDLMAHVSRRLLYVGYAQGAEKYDACFHVVAAGFAVRHVLPVVDKIK